MNPFEDLMKQTIIEHEMTRSQSFDFLNVQSIPSQQQQMQSSSITNAIGYDPARMSNFLGHQILNNKPTAKLETIHENIPMTTSNFSSQLSAKFRSNQTNDQQSSDKQHLSIRGSVSSWNL